MGSRKARRRLRNPTYLPLSTNRNVHVPQIRRFSPLHPPCPLRLRLPDKSLHRIYRSHNPIPRLRTSPRLPQPPAKNPYRTNLPHPPLHNLRPRTCPCNNIPPLLLANNPTPPPPHPTHPHYPLPTPSPKSHPHPLPPNRHLPRKRPHHLLPPRPHNRLLCLPHLPLPTSNVARLILLRHPRAHTPQHSTPLPLPRRRRARLHALQPLTNRSAWRERRRRGPHYTGEGAGVVGGRAGGVGEGR